ncbi:MAG: hypothetical protein ACK2U1_25715 [Anaerolineales bacterium]
MEPNSTSQACLTTGVCPVMAVLCRTRLSQGDKSFAVVDGRLMTETGVAETTYMRYF